MNHFKKTIATLLAATMCVSMLTACTKANCKAESYISFVTSDELYPLSFGVGNEVTMNLRYKVTSAEASVTPVKAILTIPNVRNVLAVDMYYQTITSKYDPNKNVTTYELTADASENAEMQECVIQFRPNAEGTVEVKLVYDGHVDSSYDVSKTIEFVDYPKRIDEGEVIQVFD